MKKNYIRLKPLTTVQGKKSNVKKAEEQDKIARLYALAEKLHVKIGV